MSETLQNKFGYICVPVQTEMKKSSNESFHIRFFRFASISNKVRTPGQSKSVYING